MPHAEINVPGLILVGRFSSDPHWPVLGDPEAVSPASVWRVLKQAGLLSRWKGKPSRKGTGFEQPPQPHRHWHIDVSCINLLGTRLEYAYSKTLYGANSESQWEKSLRVCTTRYFDFYFQLVVPEGEVPVADIETTLESTRDQNEMVQNLIRYVNTGRLRPALETLRARLKSIPAERLVNVLGALLEIGDRARHSGSMIAGQVPEILYVNLAIFDVIDILPPQDRVGIIEDRFRSTNGVGTAADRIVTIKAINEKENKKYGEFDDQSLSRLQSIVVDRIRLLFEAGDSLL